MKMMNAECGMMNVLGLFSCGANPFRTRIAFWCGVRLGLWELRVGFMAVVHAEDLERVPLLWCSRRRWQVCWDDVLRHTWTVGVDVFQMTLGRRVA